MGREQADQALFNEVARRYAKKDIAMSSSLARKSQLLSAVAPILERTPNLGTIVEIGCGVGAPALYLSEHYERYIGIDQSEEMIKAARAFNRGNPRAEFIAANVKSKDLPQNVADTILSVGALHHMIPLDEVMKSLNSIARSGAFLVATEPQNRNPLIQVMRWMRGIIDSAYSQEQIFFSAKELKKLFTSHGITNLEIDFQGFLTPPFAQVIIPPQVLTTPLSRLVISIEKQLHAHLPKLLKQLSFNVVVTGRFT